MPIWFGKNRINILVFFVLDLNECGLKPRPCEHRCMNTFGSYKCYCLNGYTLMSDGSCASESILSTDIHMHKSAYLKMSVVYVCV